MGFFNNMADKIIEAGRKERARREAEEKSSPELPLDHVQGAHLEQTHEPQAPQKATTKNSPLKIISLAACGVFAAFFLVNALSSHSAREPKNSVQDSVNQQATPELQQPFTEDNLNLNFSDATQGKITLTLNSIAIGYSGVEKGVVYQMHLNEALEQNKDVYYFNITLKNISGEDEENVHNYNFKLEDNEGNTYKDVTTRDALRGGAGIGKKVTGGISFHVNKSNYPVRLVYDTKYVVTMTGEKKFSYLDNLQKIQVIKRGSSAESVGSLRFWQVAKCMIQGDFHHFKVSETVCFT